MKDPLVSVIIPNYNHSEYLEERIESVLNQTYTSFEVIILDDCSTDNSIDVIDRYRNNSRISQIIINKKNSGSPFHQWKRGINVAKGEIIWIAESDDMCSSLFLKEMVDFYISNDLVMAYSQSRKIDSKGNDCGLVQKAMTHNIIGAKKMIFDLKSRITNASSAIFNREIAMSLNNGFENLNGAGDWLFWAGIAQHGEVGFLCKPLCCYRIHGDNTTARLFRNGTDFKELYVIYQYLYSKGIWSIVDLLKEKIRMSYAIKYKYSFDSDLIRNELIKIWRINNFFYRLTDIFLKFKSKQKQK
mgnify:CR=1 FL=1